MSTSSLPIDYVPNFSTFALHVWNGLSLFLIIFGTWFISGTCTKAKGDRLLLCWWALTGLIHIIQEGYFVFTPDLFNQKSPNFVAELWIEYSKGDSRYASRHTSVLAIEGMAAVIMGPLSLLVVYSIVKAKSYNYILQFGVSIAQLYGACLYFLTAFLEGDNFASSPYYYSAYYVGQSSIWIIVPSLIAIKFWRKINAICHLHDNKKAKNH